MFQGGTMPIGKHSYLNERCVPKISYDFQAPAGEFGRIRDSYRCLKLLHLFFREFAERLCPMRTVLPEGAAELQPADTETPRFAARMNGDAGFLFLTNYQDHLTTGDHEGFQIVVKLPEEEITVPARAGLTLKRDVSAILPLNLDLDGVLLKYATAQPITSLEAAGESYYFFFAPEGIACEYCLDNGSLTAVTAPEGTVIREERRTFISVTPGLTSTFTVAARAGRRMHLCTLTRKQALCFWKVKIKGAEMVLLTEAAVLMGEDRLELRQAGDPSFRFHVFSAPVERNPLWRGEQLCRHTEGIFGGYTLAVEPKDFTPEWVKAGAAKAAVKLPPEDFTAINELFLRIDYLGDVGNAFIDGRLIHDNFCNGEIWEIGLKRFYPEAAEKGIYLAVTPVNPDQVHYDATAPCRQEALAGARAAEIRSLALVPEYRAVVRFT